MAFYKNSYLSLSQNGVCNDNLKYKKKYNRLKKKIKYLVFENGALCDEVARVQENILLVKEERKFLFKKLLDYEDVLENYPPSNRNTASPSTSHSDNNTPSKKSRTGTTRDSHKMVVFPMCLGNLTVYSLGDIISDKPLYHTEDIIYPVGYTSTRIYGSLRDPLKKCVYTCKIIDGGNEPRFEIAADSDFDSPIVGASPNYCHGILLQYINDAADMMNFSIFPKGARFFGLSHPMILNHIQNLQGAKKCSNYKWRRQEVSQLDNYDSEESDPTINFDMLQKCIISPYHTMGEIKEEPPDDILDFSEHC